MHLLTPHVVSESHPPSKKKKEKHLHYYYVAIVYGSLITMRHLETTEGFLHSHDATYADGSQQQQVTLYPHRDNNNWWRILKADVLDAPKKDLLASDNTTWLEYVRNGDTIRLEHVETAPRKLHSHDIPAPVTDTDYHKEVSAYGFQNHLGDANDNWLLRIDSNNEHSEAGEFLQSRRSKFRLKHVYQECYLFASFERLPDWGYDQQEVSCISEGTKPKTMWQIDESDNRILPEDVQMEPEHRPKFFEKFARLHKYMWIVNNELTDSHPFESRPSTWPLLLSGGISFWQTSTKQIILLGNPLVYWSSTAAVVFFLALFGVLQICQKRGYNHTILGFSTFYQSSAGFFVLAWALHYLPFFRMERQLFFHHYMPSLYFAVLTLGVAFDLLMKKFPASFKVTVLLAFSTCLIYTWWTYAPITYGTDWTVAQCDRASLLDRWDLQCERYYPLGSPEREVLSSEEEFSDKPTNVIYVDGEGQRVPKHEVPQEYLDDEDYMDEEFEDEEEDEEDEVLEPTEAPEPPEYEPEFIDGKEVFGEDDEDEEDWPRTMYGMEEDEEEEVHKPVTLRSIPATRYI